MHVDSWYHGGCYKPPKHATADEFILRLEGYDNMDAAVKAQIREQLDVNANTPSPPRKKKSSSIPIDAIAVESVVAPTLELAAVEEAAPPAKKPRAKKADVAADEEAAPPAKKPRAKKADVAADEEAAPSAKKVRAKKADVAADEEAAPPVVEAK